MTGENESVMPSPPPKNHSQLQVEKLNQVLDQYEAACGMPVRPTELVSEATALMTVNREVLRGMSADDCDEAAILLQQFAFHLQRFLNYHAATALWASENIKQVIAPRLTQQNGYGYQERSILAINENEFAKNLNKLKARAETYVARLSYLPGKAEAYAKYFSNLAQTKKKQHG